MFTVLYQPIYKDKFNTNSDAISSLGLCQGGLVLFGTGLGLPRPVPKRTICTTTGKYIRYLVYFFFLRNTIIVSDFENPRCLISIAGTKFLFGNF